MIILKNINKTEAYEIKIGKSYYRMPPLSQKTLVNSEIKLAKKAIKDYRYLVLIDTDKKSFLKKVLGVFNER